MQLVRALMIEPLNGTFIHLPFNGVQKESKGFLIFTLLMRYLPN